MQLDHLRAPIFVFIRETTLSAACGGSSPEGRASCASTERYYFWFEEKRLSQMPRCKEAPPFGGAGIASAMTERVFLLKTKIGARRWSSCTSRFCFSFAHGAVPITPDAAHGTAEQTMLQFLGKKRMEWRNWGTVQPQSRTISGFHRGVAGTSAFLVQRVSSG